MLKLRFFGTALAAAMLAGTAFAAAQTATPVPDLKPDFSSMNFQLGTWTCKTTKNDMGRGSGRSETDTNTMSMDGHYMQTDSVSHPFDAARTRDLVSRGWMGYDTTSKSWYAFGIGNFGGFGMQTSPGWQGNTIVWTDTYASDGSPLGVATVTKVSDTQTTSNYVVTTPSGKQTTSDICTKNS